MHYDLPKTHQKNMDIMAAIKAKVITNEKAKHKIFKKSEFTPDEVEQASNLYFSDKWYNDCRVFSKGPEGFVVITFFCLHKKSLTLRIIIIFDFDFFFIDSHLI